MATTERSYRRSKRRKRRRPRRSNKGRAYTQEPKSVRTKETHRDRSKEKLPEVFIYTYTVYKTVD